MSDVIQQLPALIGVVIGASASYLAGAATERTRWRREQSSRWDEKRAQAYAEYAHAIKNVYVQCRRVASIRGRGTQTNAIEYDKALDELGKLTDERTVKWESVLLLGNPRTVAAGQTWHRDVWQVELFARGERTDVEQWNAVLDKVIDDRTRFYIEARRDLGIKSGDLPPGEPWGVPPTLPPGPPAAI